MTVMTEATKYVGVSARDLCCCNTSSISHVKQNSRQAMNSYRGTSQHFLEKTVVFFPE